MQHRPADAQGLLVLIVDDHEVSRAACRALLRTEGLEVIADLAADDDQALAAADALCPDVAIVDVSPGHASALHIARRLRALRRAPTVVLTSSTSRSAFDAQLDGYAFIAKADVCSEQILRRLPRPTRVNPRRR
jgi:DNA-binding NarL/FixJ family response regulator